MELPDIADLHDRFTAAWHRERGIPSDVSGFARTVVEQHARNFDLWHQEDRARAPQASAEEIAFVKRAIDALNQQRNDLMERIDTEALRIVPPGCTAELHSETPGMMIDRLSILSLKIFHTREELDRPGTDETHKKKNGERLAILNEQRQDLWQALQRLWQQSERGERRFKVYRQLKMYNDPALNPEIYRAGGSKA